MFIQAIKMVALVTSFLLFLQLATQANTSVMHLPANATWQQKLTAINWVAYSPTNYDPNSGMQPSYGSIINDLQVLRKAGFTGIVTYGSDGAIGQNIATLAKREGFMGLIMGVWTPNDPTETNNARAAAPNPIVLGYCIGNEGLMNGSYSLASVQSAMQGMRSATGKPVTSTETVDNYGGLFNIVDWVYPNAHPYWHNVVDPVAAISWTVNTYNTFLTQSGGKPLVLKEVGLPNAGATNCSDASQQSYYLGLANTPVKFNYFEAYDQPWKNWAPVEPHWGLFYPDRTPHMIAQTLLAQAVPSLNFTVYDDFNTINDHYVPSGYMGDTSSVTIDQNCTTSPFSGSSCIKVTYSGKGSNGWAGCYWLDPVNNWGTSPTPNYAGYDLSLFTKMQLYVRADTTAQVKFFVGGINNPYGDSQTTPLSTTVNVGQRWQLVTVPLNGANLAHIIGGLGFTVVKNSNPTGCTFYIDNVKFLP